MPFPAELKTARPKATVEASLQAAIVQYLRLMAHRDCIFYAIPNGEFRSKRTGARLKAQGVLRGAPDLAFVLPNGQPAYIELKAPGGRLSPEQRDFMEKCIRLGVPHVVVADIDTALMILRGWGVLPDEHRIVAAQSSPPQSTHEALVRAEAELPTWDDLRGAAPDSTDGLSSEVFVRKRRGEWR